MVQEAGGIGVVGLAMNLKVDCDVKIDMGNISIKSSANGSADLSDSESRTAKLKRISILHDKK